MKRYQYFKDEIDLNNMDYGDLEEDDKKDLDDDLDLDNPPEEMVIFHFILQISLRVEVLNQNLKADGTPDHVKSEMIPFRKEPMCFFLTDVKKAEFIASMKIDKLLNKRMAIYHNIGIFKLEMEKNKDLYERHPTLYKYTSFNTNRWICYILYGLTVIINCFALAYLEYNGDNRQYEYRDVIGKWIVYGLSILVCSIAFLYIMIWIITKYRMRVEIEKLKYRKSNPGVKIMRGWPWVVIHLWNCWVDDYHFINFFLHLIFGVLSFWWYPALALHLLLLANLNYTVRYVIQAVTDHIWQVIFTIILTIFLIYGFTLILAQFFFNDFDFSDDSFETINSRGTLPCETLISCLFYTTDIGLRMGGGISEMLLSEPWGSSRYFGRFFFD